MLTLALFSMLSAAAAQQVGTNTAETHPKLSWKKNGSSQNGEIVIDSNWRWVHKGKLNP